MIIVFTGGDELEDNDQDLEDYLGHECPEAIQVEQRLRETIERLEQRLDEEHTAHSVIKQNILLVCSF
ncbi:hypothetical protein FRX31_029929 [Thalictrum thalictroides]|uniref:Uncharacterized protein n=1 Tax=Thalictrum thalictroides TaxID=46969 RepID=A0A7J6V7V6_THATH|nr:hypothetical protein FRX31_029929 [Thalictrum thalictroides]